VSILGLEKHLCVLQEYFADNGPADLDLRIKVNVRSSIVHDCISIRQSVTPFPLDQNNNNISDNDEASILEHDPCTKALVELAKGVASLADGPLENNCEGVFLRIVCASDYKAIDPMYHTDKAPLRGYVTLRGVGTEFMTRVCTPLEYIQLRSLGSGIPTKDVRQAQELEFIVMKGDYYIEDKDLSLQKSLMKNLWTRSNACVHRSPSAAMEGSRRRVIISLDLADGEDGREWYQTNTKREWRAGMTQRKSKLVA